VIHGGLGKGNLGVIAARHGTGKAAVLMSIAIDKALQGSNVLQVTTHRSVSALRTYRDEVLHEMERALGFSDRGATQTLVERHTRFHTYRSVRTTNGEERAAMFSIDRLRTTLTFAREHAEFSPDLLEIEGWPDFNTVDEREVRELKILAQDFDCEVWLTDHTDRDSGLDAATGIPANLARFDNLLSVVISLEPEAQVVPLKFLKVHGKPIPAINLSFDPKSMLLRW
jgi:hypothetical protein